MVITQNYGLIWKGLSEEIIAGISKYQAVNKSLSVHQSYCKILEQWGMSKVPRNFVVLTLLPMDFMMFSSK